MDDLIRWIFHDQFFSVYFALILALGAMKTAVSALHNFVVQRLDQAHPDDLPVPARQFAEQAAKRMGLHVRIYAAGGEKAQDAYFPWFGLITLTPAVYLKRDPTGWAVAAHELGHARVHQRTQLLSELMNVARQNVGGWGWFASTVVLAQLLYGSPALSQLALPAIGITIGMYVMVLLDELLASSIAMRILREDGRLSSAQLRAARHRLIAAFTTYAVGLGSYVALLVLWSEIEQRAPTDPFVPALPLTGGWSMVASALALSVMAMVLWNLYAMLFSPVKRLQVLEAVAPLLSGLPTLPLLWIVWDQAYGAWWPLTCVMAWRSALFAAIIPMFPVFLVLGLVVAMGTALVIFLVSALLTPWRGGGSPQQSAEQKAEQESAVRECAPRLAEATRTPQPSLSLRVAGLAHLMNLLAPVPLAAAVLWAEMVH